MNNLNTGNLSGNAGSDHDKIGDPEEKKHSEIQEKVSSEDENNTTSTEEIENELSTASDEVNPPVSKTDTKEKAQQELTESVIGETKNSDSVESIKNSEKSGTDDTEEEHEEHEEDHEENIDYSEWDKKQLVDELRRMVQESDVMTADKVAKAMLPHYEEIFKKEKEEALIRYRADGGEESDFEYRKDELDERFEANFKLIQDRKIQFLRERDLQRESNLKKKEDVLEKLRQFVDSEETNISFNEFKKLQDEWKAIGPIPPVQAKTLWANYHALIDRFYDNRSIYFELKELDRKRNLEAKLELCERAEKLAEHENLKEAITELNELHNEFKHLGPVPKDEQEALWQRFKSASDTIYQKRKAFVDQLKVSLEENYQKKKLLSEKLDVFIGFDSDRIKEWNSKTSEILEIQKEWDAIGGLPRNKAKELNRHFWSTFKTFFANKNKFFKQLDADREENLIKKKGLIDRAIALKESEDFDETTEELKKLQEEWKSIGPVPEKQREKTYQEFKAACDHFFERKRGSRSKSEKEYEENLRKKEEICAELENKAKEKKCSIEELEQLREQFNSLGFVPKKSIRKIKSRYDEAVKVYLENIEGIDSEEKNKLLFREELNRMKSAPSGQNKLYRKEQDLRRSIHQLENDISLWKNNLEFFAASKTADKLRLEFNEKIEKAEEQIRLLKQELREVRSI